jgi:hypothetical protein
MISTILIALAIFFWGPILFWIVVSAIVDALGVGDK